MACLHENTRPHQEDWEDEQWRTVTDNWCECLDCGEVFTPSEWDRECESIERERERDKKDAADDVRFHRWQEDQVA